MSNAIAQISAALGYDAIEEALVLGSLADAMKIAATIACASDDADTSPVSFRPTMMPATECADLCATVRPMKKAA